MLLSFKTQKLCLSSGCKIEENIDYNSNDIVVHGTCAFPHGTNSAKNWQSCADLCASTKACSFWTWSTKGDLCWIKNSNSGRKVNVGAVSGNKKCGVDKTQHHYPIYRSSLCKKWKGKSMKMYVLSEKNIFKCFLFVNFTQICIHGELESIEIKILYCIPQRYRYFLLNTVNYL